MLLTTKNLGEIVLENRYSNLNKESNLGQCKIHMYKEKGIKVFSGDFTFEEDVTLEVAEDSSEVVAFFNLAGTRATHYSDFNKDLTLGNADHNILYAQQNKNSLFLPKGMTHKSLVVYYDPKEFTEIVTGFDHKATFDFLNSIVKETSCMVRENHMKLSSEMLDLAWQLRSDVAQQKHPLFIKSSVYNLLGLQMEALTNPVLVDKTIANTDLLKIEKVQRLLLIPENQAITVKELALEVGLNTTKLKSLFKTIFGKPIKSYQLEYRMLNAKKLLVESTKTIAEIGYTSGYEYPEHFNRAFKKYFGFAPGSLRKTK